METIRPPYLEEKARGSAARVGARKMASEHLGQELPMMKEEAVVVERALGSAAEAAGVAMPEQEERGSSWPSRAREGEAWFR